jgi:hypothetical protein
MADHALDVLQGGPDQRQVGGVAVAVVVEMVVVQAGLADDAVPRGPEVPSLLGIVEAL